MSEHKKSADNNLTESRYERTFELERLVFFSDAVFAIAITLLALDLRVPDIGSGLEPNASAALMQAVFNNGGRFLAFSLSFYIIGIFWIADHRYFRYIVRFDGHLLRINLILLFFIVVTPYTTSMIGEYGNLQFAIILYSLNLMAVGLSTAWLWHYSTHNHRLVDSKLDPHLMQRIQVRAYATPLTAVIVIALTFFVGNGYASFGWFLIILIQPLIERFLERGEKVK